MGTWNLIGAVASFLICSHQAQAATWAPDETRSCKSEALIQLHSCWSKKIVPIWFLLGVEALCPITTGCQHHSVQAVRSQDFILHLALTISPVWDFWWRLGLSTSVLSAPVRALLSPVLARQGHPAGNQVIEWELNKLWNYSGAFSKRKRKTKFLKMKTKSEWKNISIFSHQKQDLSKQHHTRAGNGNGKLRFNLFLNIRGMVHDLQRLPEAFVLLLMGGLFPETIHRCMW